jgi:hypothetical protein
MKKEKITLRNDFHGTEVNIRANDGDILSTYQMRRIEKKLCGMDECCCGIVRGPQRDKDGNPLELESLWDGSHEVYCIRVHSNDWE